MLHLIPEDDGLPHAPTSECGCDPQPGRYHGRTVLMHLSADAQRQVEEQAMPGCFRFDAYTDKFIRLREVMGHE